MCGIRRVSLTEGLAIIDGECSNDTVEGEYWELQRFLTDESEWATRMVARIANLSTPISMTTVQPGYVYYTAQSNSHAAVTGKNTVLTCIQLTSTPRMCERYRSHFTVPYRARRLPSLIVQLKAVHRLALHRSRPQ